MILTGRQTAASTAACLKIHAPAGAAPLLYGHLAATHRNGSFMAINYPAHIERIVKSALSDNGYNTEGVQVTAAQTGAHWRAIITGVQCAGAEEASTMVTLVKLKCKPFLVDGGGSLNDSTLIFDTAKIDAEVTRMKEDGRRNPSWRGQL